MSTSFCGIPCTLPNRWELHLHAPAVGRGNATSTPALPAVQLQIASLDMMADFFNQHHSCCWPRTLLDAHLGQAVEDMARASALQRRGTSHDKQHGLADGDSAATTPDHARGHLATTITTTTALFLEHVIHVAEQLFRAQQERPPRATQSRRVVFHKAVPPVLRCSSAGGDSLVYLIEGRLVLTHRCPPSSHPSQVLMSARGGAPCAALDAAQQRDFLARHVFPLFLIMEPSPDCAAFVDAEHASASAATEWRSMPMLLALETVEPEASTRITPGLSSSQAAENVVWCATYSPFTWTVNPRGNEHMSALLKTCKAVTHMPRRRPPQSRHHASGLPIQKELSLADEGAPLEPLPLSFSIYATHYTSEAARMHILSEMESSCLYVPHVTQMVRFGLGKGNVSSRNSADAAAEQVASVRTRRPAQLMRLLDGKLEFLLQRDELPGTKVAREVDIEAIEDAPPQKASRAANVPGPASAVQSEVRRPSNTTVAVPSVTTVLLGTLTTARPIEREWCGLSKATTLVSVLRKARAAPQASVETDARVGGEPADSFQATRAGWPLRVALEASHSSGETVALSPLSTLQNLADALRVLKR